MNIGFMFGSPYLAIPASKVVKALGKNHSTAVIQCRLSAVFPSGGPPNYFTVLRAQITTDYPTTATTYPGISLTGSSLFGRLNGIDSALYSEIQFRADLLSGNALTYGSSSLGVWGSSDLIIGYVKDYAGEALYDSLGQPLTYEKAGVIRISARIGSGSQVAYCDYSLAAQIRPSLGSSG